MAIADIVQRPGLLLAAALALHVGLISAQVTTQTGDTIFHAVVFGGVLLVQVEDSGPGIPQAERELVFQPFYRALGTNVDGSGLGLPIVQEIARQHRAEIQLEDAHPGQVPPGMRFTVRFSSVRGAADARAELSQAAL